MRKMKVKWLKARANANVWCQLADQRYIAVRFLYWKRFVLKRQENEGVDYFVVDAVPRLLGFTKRDFGYLALEASQSGELVKTLVPGELTIFQIEIYAIPNAAQASASDEHNSAP